MSAVNTDWQARAICVGADPELFFPAADGGPAQVEQETAAKAVCANCPVLAECREWALATLPDGVAGGLTERERRQVRLARRRAVA